MAFPLSISESATLFDLRRALEELTGIPAKEQYLATFQGSRVSLLSDKDDYKSLFELR